MKTIDNKTMFSFVRDTLAGGDSVSVAVCGQSMIPFFQSGATIRLRPIRPEDLKPRNVVFGEKENGTFVVHRIVGVSNDEVVLLGDGNLIGTERIPRNKIYGIVDCGCLHLLLAGVWIWMRPARKYPLMALRKLCRK